MITKNGCASAIEMIFPNPLFYSRATPKKLLHFSMGFLQFHRLQFHIFIFRPIYAWMNTWYAICNEKIFFSPNRSLAVKILAVHFYVYNSNYIWHLERDFVELHANTHTNTQTKLFLCRTMKWLWW